MGLSFKLLAVNEDKKIPHEKVIMQIVVGTIVLHNNVHTHVKALRQYILVHWIVMVDLLRLLDVLMLIVLCLVVIFHLR